MFVSCFLIRCSYWYYACHRFPYTTGMLFSFAVTIGWMLIHPLLSPFLWSYRLFSCLLKSGLLSCVCFLIVKASVRFLNKVGYYLHGLAHWHALGSFIALCRYSCLWFYQMHVLQSRFFESRFFDVPYRPTLKEFFLFAS